MIRLFIDVPFEADKPLIIKDNAFHYLKNVMRKGINDNLAVFNGKDGEWLATIKEISKKHLTLCLNKQTLPQSEPAKIHLYFALLKKDKVDLVAEKTTELDIASLTPIITERTITDKTNPARLKLIAIEAAEQCERTHIPLINEPVKFSNLLDIIKNNPAKPFFIMDERGKGKAPKEAFTPFINQEVSFIIGPEGGFTEKEFSEAAKFANIINVSMGKNVFRAETAAIVAISAWHTISGNFN